MVSATELPGLLHRWLTAYWSAPAQLCLLRSDQAVDALAAREQLEERQLLGARALGGLRARVDVDRREAHLSRVGRRVLRGEWCEGRV